MKYLIAFAAMFLCFSLKAADVTLVVKNINNLKGDIAFGFYKDYNWLDDKKYLYSVREKVTSSTMRLTVKNVKPGVYGIAGYHDEDLDHEVDKNIIGLPTEQIGFSNGAEIGLGAPDFEEAQIKVTENGKNEFVIVMD